MHTHSAKSISLKAAALIMNAVLTCVMFCFFFLSRALGLCFASTPLSLSRGKKTPPPRLLLGAVGSHDRTWPHAAAMALQLNREPSASKPPFPPHRSACGAGVKLSSAQAAASGPALGRLSATATVAGPRVFSYLAAERPEHRSAIGFSADRLFSVKQRRHLINEALTGPGGFDFTCCPPPRGRDQEWEEGEEEEEEKPSVASQHHIKDVFRISYVIKSDLRLQEHHAAHRTAGRRVLSCSPPPKNYLLPPPRHPHSHFFPPWQLPHIQGTCTIIVIRHFLIQTWMRRCSIWPTCHPSRRLLSLSGRLHDNAVIFPWFLESH